MQRIVLAAVGLLLASAGTAGAQAYGPGPTPPYAGGYSGGGYGGYSGGCPAGYHGEGQACICDIPANFYPGYPGGGYNVHVSAPGARIIGTPVSIPGGAIYVDGPPIYVQAPPVHVASPQVYIQRPRVVVQPSDVTVEPPTVHTEGCAEGTTCEMVGQSYPSEPSYQGGPPRYRTHARAGERG